MPPKRQSVRRILSDKAQGKGSWVDWKPLTFGERTTIRAAAEEHKDDDNTDWVIEQQQQLYIEHIIDWNWVDEHDAPLPVPSKDASVIQGLTDEEVAFLDSLFENNVAPKR